MRTSVQLSVSVGAGAPPAMREAIVHYIAHPTHDPFVVLAVDYEHGEQHAIAMCHNCDPDLGRMNP